MLSTNDYYNIIKETTLSSVDLFIIKDNKLLVCERENDPAKGYLFTPGCRTYKNETLKECGYRVAKSELNLDIDIDKLILIGVYDHIYENNFIDSTFGTHYVNTAYLYILNSDNTNILLDHQHSNFKWVNDVLNHDNIHSLVKTTYKDIILL
jgi:colanic acid biosynthesis protein WcaH